MARSGANFELSFAEEIQRISAVIQATPEELTKAANRAMKKTIRWLRTRIAREVSQSIGIPQNLLKERITTSSKGKGIEQAHVVWFGIEPISAEKLKARQNKRGVRAAKHQFQGAFYKKVYGNDERVWIRKARALDLGLNIPNLRQVQGADDGRFPLVKVSVEVAVASEIFKRYAARAQDRFQTLMAQELNYVVNIEGR